MLNNLEKLFTKTLIEITQANNITIHHSNKKKQNENENEYEKELEKKGNQIKLENMTF